jgi:anti-sigma B factor antagonist
MSRLVTPGRDFSLSSGVRDGVVEVVLAGDLDMTAAFRLEPEVDRLTAMPGIEALVLDLAAIRFVDSTGLGALLAIRERAKQQAIELTLAHPSEAVERILELTGTRSALGG